MRKKLIYLLSLVFVLSMVLTNSANAADPNLQLWLKFDGDANDSSNYGNHGTLMGTPPGFVAGVLDQAVELNGTSDYVTTTSYKGVLGTHAFTVCAWIKTTNGETREIACWGKDTGTQRLEFRVHSNRLRAAHGSGNVQGDTNVNDGKWHHVAVTVKEGATVSYPDVIIYLDGQDDTQASTDPDAFNIVADKDVGIGWRPTSEDRFFDGLIDDVRIYDRVLSPAEIQKLGAGPEAYNPNPADGASYEDIQVVLSWSPGGYADKHDVYFSTNLDNVNDANRDNSLGVLVSQNQDPNYYPAAGTIALDLGQTYYWRIDEFNDPCVWRGEVWSFEVGEYVLVDDFDSYAGTFPPNEPNLLGTWKDGSTNATGSTISLETEFVGNSMKYVYDNNESPFYSEAELTYDAAADWTAGGVKALALEFRGDVNNSAEQMYVALEDATGNSAVVIYGDPNALIQEDWEGWQVWNIALQDYVDANDVNLANIKKVTIGIGDGAGPGGSGVVCFDNIRLYPPRCMPEYVATSFDDDCVTDLTDVEMLLRYWLASEYDVVAEEPNDNRLQAYYDFNETSGTTAYDSSGKGRNATVDPNGADAWDPCGYDGYCLAFDGNFAVSVPNDVFSNIQKQVTVSVWVQMDANVNPNTVGRAEFGAGPDDPNEPWDRLAWIQDRPEEHIGQWNHYAFVKDADDGLMRIYHNGLLVAQDTEAFQLMSGGDAVPSRIGSAIDEAGGYYKGKMDEFRIYDYALSHAEVLYLALGSGSELYQPLQPALSPVDPYEDGKIDFKDFTVLARWWLEEQLWP